MPKLTVRAIEPDGWQAWRAMRMRALEDAPAAFTASLADWSGSNDTEERWRARIESVELNLVAELGVRLVGMVSATTLVDGAVELLSLWVDPDARGWGIGDALVEEVVRWADHSGADAVVLDVFGDNDRAIACYLRNGFRWVADPPTEPAGRCDLRMRRRLADRVERRG